MSVQLLNLSILTRSYGHLHEVISIWEAQLIFQNLLFQFMVAILS